MNKAVLLILTGTLATLANGCANAFNFVNANQELEGNAADSIPVTAETSQSNQQPETELTEQEEVPRQKITGLIPATDPDVRVRNSVRGRNDPFAIVSLDPQIEIEPEEPQFLIPLSEEELSSLGDDELDESELVPVPSLAQEVIISGLYEADGKIRLIVQAPDEDTSRYVEVGEYLSNGQVLVKRIEQDSFSSPIIILEELGIEVAKSIGETVEAEDDEESISSLPSVLLDNNLSSSITLNSN
ncbi:MAG: hypothetical protein AAFQ80_21115 [Cyanobacteria bacterium J06621_8]